MVKTPAFISSSKESMRTKFANLAVRLDKEQCLSVLT